MSPPSASSETDAATEAWLARVCGADRDEARRLARKAVAAAEVSVPTLLTALKDASKARLTIDPTSALHLAEALIDGAEAAELPWFAALGRMARGDAYAAQGNRLGDALAELDAAAEAFSRLDDPVAWARTRIGWIYLRCLSGAASEADFVTAERARDRLLQAGEVGLAFTMERNVMSGHWKRGRIDLADRCFERAIAMADRSPSGPGPLDVAWLRANRALMLTEQARLEEALEEHEQARAIFAQLGQRDSLRRQEHNLGHLRLAMGDPGRALGHCLAALALAERDGLVLPRGLVLASVARCHLALGDPDAATAETREALTILRSQGADAEALRCSLDLARCLRALGDRASDRAAEAILERCLHDPLLPGLRAQDGMVRLDLAELALHRGDAAAATDWSTAAAERFRDGGLGLLVRLAELVAGEAALEAGQLDRAALAVDRALGRTDGRALAALQPRAWHLSARIGEAQGQADAARQAYRNAIDAMEAQRHRLPPTLRQHLLDPRLDLITDALNSYRRAGDPELLWWLLERVKAGARTRSTWLEDAPPGRVNASGSAATSIAGSVAPMGNPQTDLDRRRAAPARARVEALERRHAHLFGLRHAPDWLPGQGAPETSAVTARELEDQLDAFELELQRSREALALADWRAGDGVASSVDRETWRAPVVPAGSLLVAFGLCDSPFALLARGERRQLIDLPAGQARITELAAAWREAVEDARAQSAAGLPDGAVAAPLQALLAQLHAALVEPWQSWLDGVERLILIPHRALHGLPFAALHDGRRHLIEQHALGVAPSLAWWSTCQGRGVARSKGLVAAYSHDGALPGAAAEAIAVAGILGLTPILEAATTRQAVLEGMRAAGLVHLAAHAAARPDRPAFAHLWLADGPLLSSHDLAGLDLEGALVILSGCETIQGRRTGADETLSLGQACLQAGAASVLGSLWPVRDAAALRLMTRLYQGLSAGRSAGESLRLAQLQALADAGANPLDWAAFQLQGSCDTILPSALIQGVCP
ncbi:MAG: CHAT domain-containing protein [Caldilineae bacterium]|nr:CHAT domain-containing protein [Caldilineae bacterium]